MIKAEPEIIYEDDCLVVINKPAGMVVNRAKTVTSETVQEWFEKHLEGSLDFARDDNTSEFRQKGGVVHRLDKETSGLMVLAKTTEAYEKLKNQFLERKVHKKYIALVHGEINPAEGIISLPIERHPKVWGKFTIGTDLSRTAITEWKTVNKLTIENGKLKINKEILSLLELFPMTGRTHQLRVHLKHLGHPIAGDPLYLGDKLLKTDRTWCPRMFLHAASLKLIHPESGEILEWNSKLPPELGLVLEKLVHY